MSISTAVQQAGGVPVLVEYEFTPGERAIYYPADAAHPGSPDAVDIVAVRIGQHRIDDPHSVFTEWQLEQWEQSILDSSAAPWPRGAIPAGHLALTD